VTEVIEARVTAREVIHRLRQPAWVASQALRFAQQAFARISPSQSASLYRRVSPLTMCSYSRLRSLHQAVLYIEENNIPGDIVECGVARGGSAAMMALALRDRSRRLWLFDTFEGLPAPSRENPDHHIASAYTNACRASLDEVRSSLQRLGIGENTVMVPGLFQETLPGCEVQSISILHVDGDWYESVKAVLQNLYDRVTPGGIVQFDDYGHWAGARLAVDEFLRARNITQPLRRIDFSGRQLIKT
jgi:predicted O-methyltransferase YrrM